MNKQEAYQKAKKYYKGDELAAKTLINKYCINDSGKWHEATYDDVVKRVAKEVNHRYATKDDYEWLLLNKYFIPGGRGLFGIGNPFNKASIANCYVIPIQGDDIESIFKAAQEAAKTYAYGGGVGLVLDILRPSGSKTRNASKTSTGVVSFMELYSKTTGTIGQSGRRGAQLLGLNIAHPDIELAIEAKKNGHDIRFANISVIISDEFMECLKNDGEWKLWHPDLIDNNCPDDIVEFRDNFKKVFLETDYTDWDTHNFSVEVRALYDEWIELQQKHKANIIPYGWFSPYYLTTYEDYYFLNDVACERRKKKVYKKVRAKDLWHKIAESAWASAEPGVIFIDTVKNRLSHAECNFMEILGTNPCLTGDTLVAVADGRGAVPIKQLAEEGKDVPVHCVDENGVPTIRFMRRPRCTGVKEIYEVKLSSGDVIKCTGNHKFILSNGETKTAEELAEGDSLLVGKKSNEPLGKVYGRPKEQWSRTLYEVIRTKAGYSLTHQALFDLYYPNQRKSGYRVHHKNFNSLDNRIENLELMEASEHRKLHMVGDNNPVKRWYKNAPESERQKYHKNMSKSVSGLKNGRAYKVTNEENSPYTFRDYKSLLKQAHKERSLPYSDDPIDMREIVRYYTGYYHAKTNLPLILENNRVYVIKKCEGCGKELKLSVGNREICYCENCAMWHKDTKKSYLKINIMKDIVLSLIFKNRVVPTPKECLELLKEKYGVKRTRFSVSKLLKDIIKEQGLGNITWNIKGTHSTKVRRQLAEELINKGLVYNHKVVSVRKVGVEPVYNGTVDEYHNFGIILKDGYVLYTRQCGELPLSPYGACNLGNLNLNAFVKNNQFDYELLEKATDIAVRFLNDMLDYGLDKHPLPQQRLMAWATRKIGLGITGLADMLLKLKIRYGSPESFKQIRNVLSIIRASAFKTSIELAKKHGCFPLFNLSGYENSDYIREVKEELADRYGATILNDLEEHGIYNASLLTVPPVGSGSIVLQTSTGIEPIFAWKYTRKTESVEAGEYDVYHPYLKKYLEDNNLTYEEWDNSKEDYWASAYDIDYKDRVRLQGLITKFLDSSLSSTVNLPQNTSIEDVIELYRLAYDCGCKGITIYRDGCLLEGVLKSEGSKKKEIAQDNYKGVIKNYELDSKRYRLTTPIGSLHVFINHKDNYPLEIFISQGKAGTNEKADREALGRAMSKALQYGCPPRELAETLVDIMGTDVWFNNGKMYKSIPDAVGKILLDFIGETVETKKNGQKCPACGKYSVIMEGGCNKCLECGWSKCS
ncbi:HNH endonuclease [Thermoanaerobacter sp. A7A]|uniref:TSCPD domain-containing protein n=1 Tax=Thermoanaerobacter sp. A7A TaxID=1350366 RepID=UPI00041A1705|nr:HNH endonuclease [Thermoanaerobacter sp. A7A]